MVRYVVYRNGIAVGTTAGRSYNVSGLECGTTYNLGVEAEDAMGHQSPRAVISAATAICIGSPPRRLSAPTVSGDAEAGEVLIATNGTWSGTTPIVYSYKWLSCEPSGTACSAIQGATAKTYTPSPDLEGATIRVRVTATNPGGATSARSQPTAPVASAQS